MRLIRGKLACLSRIDCQVQVVVGGPAKAHFLVSWAPKHLGQEGDCRDVEELSPCFHWLERLGIPIVHNL